jgi:parallel beta helix pectate lyase-like protein
MSISARSLALLLCGLSAICSAATLEVGAEKEFIRIEDANTAARPGDVILVHALADSKPYEKTAVYIRQPRLTFRAVPAEGEKWITISGKGFDYSGKGSTPRAIFQFNAGTDGCSLEGFELTEAHNGSHNGAGVRINQANHVTVRNCNIHNNDMGIMSGGNGSLDRAVDQRIEHCLLHHNGNFEDPGYNHNLYLGGTSVALRFCEIHHSLTGHNVKSRAHHTRVEYCYVHDSANREFDLVDAADTERPESDAVILGCIVVKNPQTKGNKTVLHFGQDGRREHDGTVTLAFNTIVTPFISPVVELSTAKAKARLVGNLVTDGGRRQANQQILRVRGGAKAENGAGEYNVLSGDFSASPGASFKPKLNMFRRLTGPLFVAPENHNYRLRPEMAGTLTVKFPMAKLALPVFPGAKDGASDKPLTWQYAHPAGAENRELKPFLSVGAY